MKEGENKESNLQDDFAGYSTKAKILLFGLFFFLGILNHLGTVLVMTGGRLLAQELHMDKYVTIYTSVAIVFSIITRMVNSKLCLKVSYKKRIIIICFWMIFGYLSMFLVLHFHESFLQEYNVLCFLLSFIPCFFLGSSYAFGENAIVAYLRLFPKTLIAGWSSGTGLSGIISGGLNLSTQLLKKFSLKFLYLSLIPVGPIYLFLFLASYKLLRKDNFTLTVGVIAGEEEKIGEEENKKDEKEEKIIDDKSPENENNEEKKDEETEKEIEEEIKEEKTLEDMNKENKTMNWINFKKVMKMCGRVIVNLGFIYFFQFVCNNAIVIQICSRLDIPFLPMDPNKKQKHQKKGKYEFVNMFFQLGMFISKTFIKLVRKIQPIEVYTVVITSITFLYFINYYAGFLPWWALPIINTILGFFSGGTYAGGFFFILHSGQVLLDYKELTVNVATLFNDTGTFLSGIVGYLLLNYVINSSEPFK